MQSGTETRNTAEEFLRLLASRGVSYFFVNSGTDFPSMEEALACAREEGFAIPRTLLIPHENVAVGMAYGVTLVTGQPQAVMVHVNVGTANALCGLINAARENIPMLMAAGRTPWFEQGDRSSRSLNIHWAQDMFDQGGMARALQGLGLIEQYRALGDRPSITWSLTGLGWVEQHRGILATAYVEPVGAVTPVAWLVGLVGLLAFARWRFARMEL